MQLVTNESKRFPSRRLGKAGKKQTRPYPHLERALAGRNTRLADLNPIAEELDVPLWVLFIPDLSAHPEMLEHAGIARLRALIENYLSLTESEREGVDVLAAHYGKVRAAREILKQHASAA